MPTLQEKALKVAIGQLGQHENPLGSNWGYVSSHFQSLDISYPKKAGIYKIKNLQTGKVYVGSANNLDRRIKKHLWELCHKRHRNEHLQNAFHQTGIEYFFFIILEECTVSELIEREQFWIDYYDSSKRENGYNKQPFAYSNKSNPLTQAAKDKISAYGKGRPKTDLHNYKNSIAHLGTKNPNYGKPISDKLRNAIIQSNKRRALKNGN